MAIMELTSQNFDEIISGNDIVVVDFWASWCHPCTIFSETFAKVANAHPDIAFAKVNIEEDAKLADDFNVRSIPLVMILKKGVVIYSEAGAMPEAALTELIEQARAVDMQAVTQDDDTA